MGGIFELLGIFCRHFEWCWLAENGSNALFLFTQLLEEYFNDVLSSVYHFWLFGERQSLRLILSADVFMLLQCFFLHEAV